MIKRFVCTLLLINVIFLLTSCKGDDFKSGDLTTNQLIIQNNDINESQTTNQAIELNEDNKSQTAIDLIEIQQNNIANRGFCFQQDDWIYFSNISDEWKLYKMKVDGSSKIKLSDYSCDNILVLGEWIYFVGLFYDGEMGSLFKIKTDGTEESVVSDRFARNLIIYHDKIYFIDADDEEPKIYAISADGTDEHLISDCIVDYFFINNNEIYYKDYNDSRLYKMGMDGKNSMQLTDDVVGDFIIANGSIYWTNENEKSGITRFKLDDNEIVRICEDKADYLNYYNDFIYYRNGSDGGKLYKISLYDLKRTKLCDSEVTNIIVTQDWIFYENNTQETKLSRIKFDGTRNEDVQEETKEKTETTHTEQINVKNLKNVFGFADETGKLLIVFENYEKIKNPDEFNYAIGDNGNVILIKYLEKQNSNDMDNNRQSMYNFKNMSGYIYQITQGNAVPDATYYFVNDIEINTKAILGSKENNNLDIDNSLVKRIEETKKMKIKNNWVLSELDGNFKLCLVEFENLNDNLLASIAYVTTDKIIFKDYPVSVDEITAWEKEIIENGEVDPQMIDLLFAAYSDEGLVIGISLFSSENEHTFLLKENDEKFDELNIELVRYTAPL